MNGRLASVLCAALVSASFVLGSLALRAADATAPQFQKGDTVCFVGDSITHGGSYHTQILLFYATRFPDRRFDSYNCGISGDSAGGTLTRYSWDVVPRKPNVATIMLGMNDVWRDNYGKDKTSPEFEAKHKQALDLYSANMLKLSQTLSDAGCKLIFITPSIYDQTGNQKTNNLFGVNDALGVCAKDCQDLAAKFNGGLVDFHTIMGKVNEEGQKDDPSFTIVGGDRVHPGNPGHMLMAYAFLKAQGVPSTVSEISVDAAKGSVVKQGNCEISDLKAVKGSVSFACKEGSLPFPIAEDVRKTLERFIPLSEDLDKETLTVSGLPEGGYEVLIDGQSVQTCSAAELQAGVNLALNSKTPQYKQAQKVAELLWKRHGIVGNLRTVAAVRHFTLNRAKIAPGDIEAENKVLDEQLEKSRKNNFTYGVWQIETYKKYSGDVQKLEKEAADLWSQAFVENQPKAHSFEIKAK